LPHRAYDFPKSMTATDPDLLTRLLRDVSRSFYRTIRLLPCRVRPQIGIAYLLARAADTIADTEVLPVSDRLGALERLRERVLCTEAAPLDFSDLCETQALPAERELLLRIEEVIGALHGLACFDRCCIREVVSTITTGQELDLRRFASASRDNPVPLQSDGELEDYTFRVAGCVGGFWTRLCRSHLYPQAPLDLPRYLDDAIRFGHGLQLVNILRDLAKDLQQGRCYLPMEGLRRHGLAPDDLLRPDAEPRFRPLYREHLEKAAAHLSAGWRYTCATPRDQLRVRLACALPLLIGSESLRLLASNNVLDASRRIKITRNRVKFLLARAAVLHPFPRIWERMFLAELPAAQ